MSRDWFAFARALVAATINSIARGDALTVIPFNGRSALDEIEANDDHRRLNEVMKTLDPMKRRLIVAAYINGDSREELSERFGAPVNTIKTWLRRAVLDIRAGLAEMEREQRVA